MKSKIHIISTALLDDELLHKLASYDIETTAFPFIRTSAAINAQEKQRIRELEMLSSVIVFTSANAVHAVGECLSTKPNWKIYCIGGATLDAIHHYFDARSVIGAAADANQLAGKIIEDAAANLVFFCGKQRLDTIPRQMAANNIAVEEIVVYVTEQTPVGVSGEVEGILFFSSSAVKSFLSLNQPSALAVCFAIGDTTAQTLKERVSNQVLVADKPGKKEIVDLVIQYYNGHS